MRIQAAAIMAAMALVSPALAQETLPFEVKQAPQAIASPESRAASDTMLSTKPAAPAPQALPFQQPQVAAPGTKALPADIPFGRSTASQYKPIPEGPHTAVAVPVENIDMIESSEPAPAVQEPLEADPANENPAEPTELTAPIFQAEPNAPPRMVIARVLNKVTARAQKVDIKPGEVVKVGKLELRASQCQRSAEGSLSDAAALFEISEVVPEEKEAKKLFAGWMYQSSPSVSALEHPVYDVMLVDCKDVAAKVEPKEKPKKSAKKPAKKR